MTENREVPLGWQNVSIGNVNDYRSTSIRPSDFPGELFELYSVPSFAMGSPEIVSGSSIGSSKQVVEPGDVLLCKINPRINRVWLVGSKGSYRQIASSEWIVVRQPMINSRYMLNYFSDGNFRTLICSEVTGVGGSLTRAQPKKVATYPLCVPSVNEQTQIANTLDELLAQVDSIKTRLDAIPAILKRVRQSVLAAAVSGRLTDDWRGSDEYENGYPVDWRQQGFSSLGELSRGKSKHRPRNDPRLFGDKYPFVQTGEIAQADDDITVASKYYSDFGLAQSRLFPMGTLCITIAANIADTALLGMEACFPDSVVGFIADEKKCDVRFIKYIVDFNKENLEAFAPATAQKNINLQVLNSLRFPLPELNEQNEIVQRAERFFEFASQTEQRLNIAQTRVSQLTQSILAKAFRGELTADWREQHPELISGENSAESLLTRIQAARAKLEPKKRVRRKKVASA